MSSELTLEYRKRKQGLVIYALNFYMQLEIPAISEYACVLFKYHMVLLSYAMLIFPP